MMSRQGRTQPKLFYTGFQLESRIRSNHPLRRLAQVVDFDFVYDEVDELYGINGNPSVPPPVILKLMLLLVFYNVRSERELLDPLPERIDWLWFLGFDLDSPVPNHSVLSKARKRWGTEVFRNFFERVVWQCVEAGLVDPRKIFVDASFVDANASLESLVEIRSVRHRVHQSYGEFERRLEEKEPAHRPSFKKVNAKRVSTTDPDAAVSRDGKPKLAYKVHRAVEGGNEIITETRTTPGDTRESPVLEALLDGHAAHTGRQADTVVADAQYGTVENLLACHERGVKTHMPHLGQAAQKRNAFRGVFGEDQFSYDAELDVLVCPAGQTLTRQGLDLQNDNVCYGARQTACAACQLRPQCTQNQAGRRVRRHVRQEVLDRKRNESSSNAGRRDIRTRQHLMERSFARSKRYGYDRARWRGLWRVEIQELLTCTVQNIQVLVSRMRPRPTAQAHRRRPSRWAFEALLRRFLIVPGVLAAVAQVDAAPQPFGPEPA